MDRPCDMLRGAGKNFIEPSSFIKFLGLFLNFGGPFKKVRWGAIAPLAPPARLPLLRIQKVTNRLQVSWSKVHQ